MATPDIKELILEHRIALQNEEKRLISEKELARMVGIDDKYFNHIFNKRRKPTQEQVKLLARFFEDPRFYDAVEMKRPDEMLDNVTRNWWRLSPKTRQKIDRLVTEDNDQPAPQPEPKTAPSQR